MNSEDLKEKIIEANMAYRKGMPIMSDIEFDNILEDYQKNVSLDEYNRFRDSLNEGFNIVTEKKKIKHDFVAGSLDKLKYEEPDLIKKFLNNHVKNALHISAKIDGLSGIAKYVNGKLVSLGTRGDGYIGEDHTEKAKYVKFLPAEISLKEPISIRGELVILKNDLSNVEGNAARNVVSGLIGRKEWNSKDISNVSFIAYTILGNKYTKEEQFKILSKIGFNVAWNNIIDCYQNENIVEKLFEYATQEFDYETDGLVISDVSYKNEDEYRPRSQVAFKTNQQVAISKIIDIEWNGPSKDGNFIPIILIEPIELGGVIISKCAGNNIEWLEKMDIDFGDTIEISRRGDVIPAINRNISKNISNI